MILKAGMNRGCTGLGYGRAVEILDQKEWRALMAPREFGIVKYTNAYHAHEGLWRCHLLAWGNLKHPALLVPICMCMVFGVCVLLMRLCSQRKSQVIRVLLS